MLFCTVQCRVYNGVLLHQPFCDTDLTLFILFSFSSSFSRFFLSFVRSFFLCTGAFPQFPLCSCCNTFVCFVSYTLVPFFDDIIVRCFGFFVIYLLYALGFSLWTGESHKFSIIKSQCDTRVTPWMLTNKWQTKTRGCFFSNRNDEISSVYDRLFHTLCFHLHRLPSVVHRWHTNEHNRRRIIMRLAHEYHSMLHWKRIDLQRYGAFLYTNTSESLWNWKTVYAHSMHAFCCISMLYVHCMLVKNGR